MIARRYRRGARFVADVRQHSRPLDRNERVRILYLAEQLERRTKLAGARNGLLGYTGLTVLRSLVLSFLRQSDGLCCPAVEVIRAATGLSRSAIFEALNRLEAAGILARVRRLVRRVVDFGGLARLTTVQTSNLYSFTGPCPNAHLLPIKRRASRNGAARLLAALTRSLDARTESALRPGTHYRNKIRGFAGGAAAQLAPSAYAMA